MRAAPSSSCPTRTPRSSNSVTPNSGLRYPPSSRLSEVRLETLRRRAGAKLGRAPRAQRLSAPARSRLASGWAVSRRHRACRQPKVQPRPDADTSTHGLVAFLISDHGEPGRLVSSTMIAPAPTMAAIRCSAISALHRPRRGTAAGRAGARSNARGQGGVPLVARPAQCEISVSEIPSTNDLYTSQIGKTDTTLQQGDQAISVPSVP